MSLDCGKISDFLSRRTPDFDKEFARDRYPFNYIYTGLYENRKWDNFTGDTHTWDRIHVTRPNDDGNWPAVNAGTFTSGNCLQQDLCAPQRRVMGWGVERSTYGQYHQDYTTPPFCLDHLRRVEEAKTQIRAIVEGLKEVPDEIMSDFIRLLALRQANTIYVAGSALATTTVTSAIFNSTFTTITSTLPTSKLTMQYLNHYMPTLLYQGYFNKKFLAGGTAEIAVKAGRNIMPAGKLFCMTDLQTQAEITNANPALTGMYVSADFDKGGKYFDYGVMAGCGNWLFKVDPTPMRFVNKSGTTLSRVWPYENVSTTVGKKPQFSTLYETANYQLSHVYARQARQIYTSSIEQIHPDMPFLSRTLNGRWAWKNPDAFQYFDINSGSTCTYYNDKHNRGYFLGEFECGMKTIYPEIELWILHLREAQAVADLPNVATVALPAPINASGAYQQLSPYNPGCDTSDEI